jgi:hypothetical protein
MFKLLPRIFKNLQNGSIEGVSIEKARKKQTFHELTQPYKRQKSLSNLGSRGAKYHYALVSRLALVNGDLSSEPRDLKLGFLSLCCHFVG